MKGLRNLLNRLSDIKTRTLLIVVGVIALVVIGLVVTTSREMKAPEVAAEVKPARIGEITSLPGTGEYNAEYAKLQLAENERLAQQAQKSGDAAIPRLINQQDENQANLSFGSEFCAECVYDAQGYDKSGYDAKGYDREGYSKEGYNADGYNREGFDREGFGIDGYNKEGYDREGYNKEGYSKEGYDRSGYDREGYNKEGYNQEGYDRNGYDREGFNKEGYNQEGYDREGYDREGYNKEGFDRNGCNRDGVDANGNVCYDTQGYNAAGYDKYGFDREGYDQNGYDKDGYDRNGFNSDGCNRLGVDAQGNPCFAKDGYDVLGYDKEGYNREGYDQFGYNKEGYDREGYNAEGYNAEGYNREGFDKEGYNKEGYNREGFDKEGFNKEGYDREGYDREGYNKEGYNRDGCNRQGFDRAGQPCGIAAQNAGAQNAEEAYRKLLEEQQKTRQAQLTAEQQAQNRERQAAEQQAMQQAFEALLQSQSMSVVADWKPGTQTYVRGVPPTAGQSGTGAGEGTGAAGTAGPVLYKAGEIVFAVIDTALNSDEPGPVLATIVQGPLQGSKVIGHLQLQEDKLLLRFNLLSSPDLPKSVPFDAVAIDAETARTALATGVDNHYFLRYGTLFASAFLEGMGEAILAGITQPVLEVDNEVLVVQSADVTVGQALLVGAGTIGQKWGEHLGEIFNKPPTVTVDSGTGIGLLFMSDFTVNEGALPIMPNNGAQLTKVNTSNETVSASSSEQAR